MASRFFAMTDSESESSDPEEEIMKEPTGISAAVLALSDEEEDTKRVVRSAKEKRYEELENLIKNVRNFKKNKDMSNLLSSFEDLTRAYQKALPVVQKEENGKTPRFYVRCLVELDDFISQMWEDKAGRKNMSKNNAKGLTTIRQKFRKYAKDYESDMSTFRENPDAPDSDGERDGADDQDSGADDDEGPIGPSAFRKDPSVSKDSLPGYEKGSDSEDDDDDSIDWDSGSDETSSSSDEGGDYISLRHKFLKKTSDIPEEEGKKPRKRERPNRQIKTIGEESEEEGKWETVKRGSAMPMEKPKMFGKDDEINVVTVHKKLNEIMAARGKKGTDRKEQIELLHELMNISVENNLGPPIQVKIQFNIITSIYDYNPSVSDPMKVDFWEKVLVKIEELLEMLISNTDITIGETVSEENESLEKAPIRVRGCVLTIVERMDEEFIKLLKACDAHSNEYIIRLRDEIKVCELIDKLLAYEENAGVPSDICRIYLRKIEHLYYKYDPNAVKQVKGEHSGPTSLDEVDRLCKYIYVRDNTDRLRTRAVLCHIYHMSLHDKWYTARDLMLMAHLQDTIQHSDLPTQILYNRTMVQLGLCAFRHGNIKDAHNALLDIQSGGRAKELLAQGPLPQRQHERTTEQEKQEKQRKIPFHQHINLEMLECVYLVSAMLIEIPYMAAHEFDARRRMISKSFHHQLKNSERQSLVGPPESMREHVVAASKAMRNGNWKMCRNLLLNEKMNAKVWDLFHEADAVRTMLGRKIQEESLRTYLFTYSHVYDSISLLKLAEMFELPYGTVHAIISKMIINEELMASLDEPTSSMVMHRTEPSSLQSLSLQLADKLTNLVENNERILDQKPFFTRNMQGGGYRERQRMGGWDNRRNRDNRRDRD